MDAVIEIREALKRKIDAADRHILEQIEDFLNSEIKTPY